MSLIDEALKKARHEAARQEAARLGHAYPELPLHSPRRRGRVPAWLAGIVGAALASALAAALLLWSGRDRGHGEALNAVAQPPAGAELQESLPVGGAPAAPATPATPLPPGPAAETVMATGSAPGGAGGPPALGTTPVAAPAPAVPISELPNGVAASPAPPTPPPPAEPSTRPNLSFSHPSPAQAQGSARLASGETVTLDGIAYSPDQPVAMINGALLSPGERIAGCRVTAIDRDQVTLTTPEGSTIVLRLP